MEEDDLTSPNLHKLKPALGYFSRIKPIYGARLYTKACWDAARPEVRGRNEWLKLKHFVEKMERDWASDD